MPIDYINGRSHSFPPHGGQSLGKVDEKRLEKVCMEFESIFFHQVMKTIRQTIPQTGFMAESKERNIFQALFDEEMSKIVGKSNRLGLGRMLYQQIQKRAGVNLSSEAKQSDPPSALLKEGDVE